MFSFNPFGSSRRIVLASPEDINRHEDGLRALEANERNRKKCDDLNNQLTELRASMEPFGHVIALASIRRVTQADQHYGYWTDDLKYLAYGGSAVDKATFTSGFATSYRGHHFGGGVHFGSDPRKAITLLGNWGELPEGKDFESFKKDLDHLAAGETDKIFFPHPKRKEVFPVYVVNAAYMDIIRQADHYKGMPPVSWSDVPLHDEPQYQHWNRYVQFGDRMVVEGTEVNYFIPNAERTYYRYV